jgi:hypothetical protein
MVQAPSAEAVEAIRNAPSLERQIASLRQLKNDIVGHDQRKELVVKQGVIQPLVDVLIAAQKASGKRRAGESHQLRLQYFTPDSIHSSITRGSSSRPPIRSLTGC